MMIEGRRNSSFSLALIFTTALATALAGQESRFQP